MTSTSSTLPLVCYSFSVLLLSQLVPSDSLHFWYSGVFLMALVTRVLTGELPRFTPPDIALLVFYLLANFSSNFGSPYVQAPGTYGTILAGPTVYLTMRLLQPPELSGRVALLLLFLFCSAGIAQSGTAFRQILENAPETAKWGDSRLDRSLHMVRATGTVYGGNPVLLGIYLLPGFFFSCSLLKIGLDRSKVLLACVATIGIPAAASGIILSGSRGPIVGGLVMLALLLLFLLRSRSFAAFAAILFLVVVAAASVHSLNPLGNLAFRFSGWSMDQSVLTRTEVYLAIMRALPNIPPFGVGLGETNINIFLRSILPPNVEVTNPYNIFLEVMIQTGAFGAAAYTIFFLLILAEWKLAGPQGAEQRALLSAARFAALAVLVTGFMHVGLRLPGVAMPFWCCVALSVFPSQPRDTTIIPVWMRWRPARAAGDFVIVLLAAGVVAAGAAFIFLRRHPAPPLTVNWTRTQSYIGEFRGEPVFTANWSGAFRPYTLSNGKLILLLNPALALPPDRSFMTPVELSPSEILFAVKDERRGDAFKIMLYDAPSSTLREIGSGEAADQGVICVSQESRRISWRSGSRQLWGEIGKDGSIKSSIADSEGGFEACRWRSDTELVGIIKSKLGNSIRICSTGPTTSCSGVPSTPETLMERFIGAPERPMAGVILRLPGSNYRRPYRLTAEAVLEPIEEFAALEADVYDFDGSIARASSLGRNFLALEGARISPAEESIHAFRRISGKLYAVSSGYFDPPHPAVLEEGDLRALPQPEAAWSDAARRSTDRIPPQEVWLDVSGGRKIQAFHFGTTSARGIVILWHGGPVESVSPRYNPYFEMLHTLGYTVLAVNYPGSSGRGVQFERESTDEDLRVAVEAAVHYAASSSSGRIVSWSISAGSRLQDILLKLTSVKISGIVDQVGDDDSRRRSRAAERGIPYFSIRGKFDARSKLPSKVDFLYEGGHDLTAYSDLERLNSVLARFLSELHPA